MKIPMFTSIRTYDAAPELADELVKRHEEVQAVFRPIEGFRAYYLIQTNGGAVSMTVCETKAGIEESNRAAGAWLRKNLPAFAPSAPKIVMGEMRMHLRELPAKAGAGAK